MKSYKLNHEAVEVCGLDIVDVENHVYRRLPEEETALVNDIVHMRSATPAGGRIRFRTNTKKLHLEMKLETLNVDPFIPVCGSAGADVLSGSGMASKYIGILFPGDNYTNKTPASDFWLDGTMQQITINLPRNEIMSDFTISIEDDAEILPPLPFTRKGRICFYGSSITEGGCASRPGNAYIAAVARWLDMDYVNYGFSGSARGEDAMADIICKRDFAAIVYDYDHNAPDPEHLEKTHEPFFKKIRTAHPDIPIVFLSKPDYPQFDGEVRRAIVMKTYRNALEAGDKNVAFIDGSQHFGTWGREMCTVDGLHPNDLGFFRMAEKVYGALLGLGL